MEIIPEKLYRLFDDKSVSKYDNQNGFRSTDQTFALGDVEIRRKMWDPVRRHLNWSNRGSTPFVSTWASSQKTLEAAKRRAERGCKNVRVAVIDVSILKQKGIWFERSLDIVRKFDVKLSQKIRGFLSPVEYLCLLSIPREAIVAEMGWKDFEEYCEDETGKPNWS